jgi:hypothetical protein
MQPTLFDASTNTVTLDQVILFALGEFQSRGHRLAGRELALDRLHGAIVRASEKFGSGQLSDDRVVKILRELGADVKELPKFVAKRPYRIVVNITLSETALEKWREYDNET